jgi:AraC-like DNA-binding protein
MGAPGGQHATAGLPPAWTPRAFCRWQSPVFRYLVVVDPDLPERAMAAFEHATGLGLCCHDQRRTLWPYLGPERFEHFNPVCALVKRNRMAACVAFCATGMRVHAGDRRGGVVKRCHAGVVELCLPVFIDERLEWILFAGARRAAPGLRPDIDDPDHSGRSGPWAPAVAGLATLDGDSASHQLELLRQLAARLVAWRQDLHSALPALASGALPPPPAARRTVILAWLAKHHPQGVRLGDLARQLGLSEDRASHAVKEACGETFVQLLTRVRLRTACGLLRFSDLPMREVALQSGYGTRAHFFAVFKADQGVTPEVYRRRASGRAAPEGSA